MKLKFLAYLDYFGKSYGTDEEFEFRLKTFSEIDEKIEKWNNDLSKTHKLIHNRFSDMTTQEKKRFTGFSEN